MWEWLHLCFIERRLSLSPALWWRTWIAKLICTVQTLFEFFVVLSTQLFSPKLRGIWSKPLLIRILSLPALLLLVASTCFRYVAQLYLYSYWIFCSCSCRSLWCFLHVFIIGRQVRKLWKDGAMKFRRLCSQELLLCSFMPLLFFTKWVQHFVLFLSRMGISIISSNSQMNQTIGKNLTLYSPGLFATLWAITRSIMLFTMKSSHK